MSYSDEDLKNAVNAVFDVYDKDKSGTLEADEICQLINDALKHMGQNRNVTQQEVQQFIQAVDKNSDGKVAKPELFEIFKKVISKWWSCPHQCIYTQLLNSTGCYSGPMSEELFFSK